MKKSFLIALLLGASTLLDAQIGIGIRIGPPPPPRAMGRRPVSPGVGFSWVDGYWFADGGHYRWHQGYWSRPPYEGAHWVGPRHEGGMYYAGYWDGGRGRFDHDHRWDRDHKVRDYGRH